MLEVLLLFFLASFAGVINSVAGGGALLTFPYLVSIGVPAVTANATISVGIFGGQASSAYGYRSYLKGLRANIIPFALLAVVGGVTGAVLLDNTSENTFKDIAPWFVLIASLLIAAQTFVRRAIDRVLHGAKSSLKVGGLVFLTALFFVVSVYGGYFGAGMGILFFALLSLSGLYTSVHTVNGVKNLITIAINLSANVYFVYAGMVSWKYALTVFVGSAIGGYFGARNASRLPQAWIRRAVVAVGVVAFIVLSVQ